MITDKEIEMKKNKMIEDINKIPELAHQFDCRFCECEDDNISLENILDVALWTKECFEEEGHYLYEGRLGYSTFNSVFKADKNLIKQYNQIKYFIKKYTK